MQWQCRKIKNFFSCTDISEEKFSSLISVQENARLDFFAAVCIIPLHRLEKFTPAKYFVYIIETCDAEMFSHVLVLSFSWSWCLHWTFLNSLGPSGHVVQKCPMQAPRPRKGENASMGKHFCITRFKMCTDI